MSVIQAAFEQTLGEVPRMILSAILSKKLKRHGIKVSGKQLSRLTEDLLSGKPFPLEIPSHRRRNLRLRITPQEIQKINRIKEQFVAQLPQTITEINRSLAPSILRSLKRTWRERDEWERSSLDGFRDRLRRRWERPFGLLGMLIAVAAEIGEGTNARLRSARELTLPNLIEVQTLLHARACQVSREVQSLLWDGFADAAMARWRTLHEIAVTMSFVQQRDRKKGDETAQRYLLHADVESFKAANEFQKSCAVLGYDPISPASVAKMKDVYEHLLERFGRGFRSQYGWAGLDLAKQEPTFADIERATKLEHLRPFYRMGSHNVHANPKGILFRLGLLNGEVACFAGRSNMGLADPGQSTGISLTQATAALIQIDPILDDVLAVDIMRLLSREAAEAFVKTQKSIEAQAKK